MVYTISNGLRDREYAKFQTVQTGSQAAVSVILASGASDLKLGVGEVVKTYDFGMVTASAGGQFDAYTTQELNGALKAIVVKHSNFAATGSLFLNVSGLDINIWQMASGVEVGGAPELPRVDQSGGYIPKAHARTNYGATLSGTANNGVWCDTPLYGHYHLAGSDVGNATHCSGIVLVYI